VVGEPVTTYVKPAPYERSAFVMKVVDGDTLHVLANLGCDVQVAMTVRLYGVNAPEASTNAGLIAKAFVEGWVAAHGPVFSLRTVKDKREKYGRYLADLVPIAGGESLCEALLAAGQAVYYLP
jgi:micrococcal nuclease